MKLKSKLIYLMLIGLGISYAACKKSSTTPSTAVTPQTVASQVAVNISQSLFGSLGAFNVSGGLSAPATFALKTKGKVLQSTNPECSLVIDTTLNVSETSNGTTATISGSFKASFTCANDLLSGYTTDDNLTISLANPDSSLSYKVAENITLVSSDPTNATANLTLSGSLSSNGSYQFKTGSLGSGTQAFNYTLTSLIISPTAGGAISGTATFSTSASGSKGAWNYQGTITFLGNNMATVTISGKAYTVNLLTGAVS